MLIRAFVLFCISTTPLIFASSSPITAENSLLKGDAVPVGVLLRPIVAAAEGRNRTRCSSASRGTRRCRSSKRRRRPAAGRVKRRSSRRPAGDEDDDGTEWNRSVLRAIEVRAEFARHRARYADRITGIFKLTTKAEVAKKQKNHFRSPDIITLDIFRRVRRNVRGRGGEEGGGGRGGTDENLTLTDLQHHTMVKEFDYGRFGDGLFARHLGTLQALRFRPRASSGNDTSGAAGGENRRTRMTGKDFLDLLKRKDYTTGEGQRRTRRRRKKRLVEFYDPAYANNAEEAVNRYLDRLKTEQAMAEEEEEEEEKKGREETGEESEPWDRQERRVLGIAPRVVRPNDKDAKILMPLNLAMKLPFRPATMMLEKIMIPFLQASRAMLSGQSVYGPSPNQSAVQVIGYNYTNLLRYYKMYYECLAVKKKFYEDTVGEPMTNIQDIMFQGGERVVLECHACLPPLVAARSYGVRWMRRLMWKGGFEDVPANEKEAERYIINDDGDLVILSIVNTDSGMYTCFKHGAHESTYTIGVEDLGDRLRVFETSDDPIKFPLPKPAVSLEKFNLQVSSTWSEWTECNACSVRGQRKRRGVCNVKILDDRFQVKPKDVQVLRDFPGGRACRSALLPPAISQLPEVKDRKTELMIGYCQVECVTKAAVMQYTDINGKVVEIVEKGRKSLRRETIPTGPPKVARTAVYASIGSRVILQCPHKDARTLAIRWQNGSILIDELTINIETKGRVYVDFNNQLVIKAAWKYDRNTYSCWVNLLRIASMKLYVAAPLDLSIMSITSAICLIMFAMMVIYMAVNLFNISQSKALKKVYRGEPKKPKAPAGGLPTAKLGILGALKGK